MAHIFNSVILLKLH